MRKHQWKWGCKKKVITYVTGNFVLLDWHFCRIFPTYSWKILHRNKNACNMWKNVYAGPSFHWECRLTIHVYSEGFYNFLREFHSHMSICNFYNFVCALKGLFDLISKLIYILNNLKIKFVQWSKTKCDCWVLYLLIYLGVFMTNSCYEFRYECHRTCENFTYLMVVYFCLWQMEKHAWELRINWVVSFTLYFEGVAKC